MTYQILDSTTGTVLDTATSLAGALRLRDSLEIRLRRPVHVKHHN